MQILEENKLRFTKSIELVPRRIGSIYLLLKEKEFKIKIGLLLYQYTKELKEKEKALDSINQTTVITLKN